MNPTPILTKRANDLGWLASPPADFHLQLAAVGATAEEAVANFEVVLERWESIDVDHQPER